jgi:hypothetical protein
MKSSGPSPDLDLTRDLPTTADDVAALRQLRPEAPVDWLERLTALSDPALFPPAPRRDRSTSAGLPPFEL